MINKSKFSLITIIYAIAVTVCLPVESSSNSVERILHWKVLPNANVNYEIGWTFGKYYGFHTAQKMSCSIISNPFLFKENGYLGYNFINNEKLYFKTHRVISKYNSINFGWFGGDESIIAGQYAGVEIGNVKQYIGNSINEKHYQNIEYGSLIYLGFSWNNTNRSVAKFTKIKIGINIPIWLVVMTFVLQNEDD